MRYVASVSLCVVAAAILCGAQLAHAQKPSPKPIDGKIKWLYSYEEGKQLAGRSGKPLFVVFRCER
jgi:hypothetical protein